MARKMTTYKPARRADGYRPCAIPAMPGAAFRGWSTHSCNKRSNFHLVFGGRDGEVVLYTHYPEYTRATRGKQAEATREVLLTLEALDERLAQLCRSRNCQASHYQATPPPGDPEDVEESDDEGTAVNAQSVDEGDRKLTVTSGNATDPALTAVDAKSEDRKPTVRSSDETEGAKGVAAPNVPPSTVNVDEKDVASGANGTRTTSPTSSAPHPLDHLRQNPVAQRTFIGASRLNIKSSGTPEPAVTNAASASHAGSNSKDCR
ncbi:hypothetical protein C8R44DRAFT_873565 [Mycena epipterygia]|nr:hypothetical protein C8R44DRAFT_873565 [Mycena epipterygia]